MWWYIYAGPVSIAKWAFPLQHQMSDEDKGKDEEEKEKEEEEEEEEETSPHTKIRKPKHICVCGKHAPVLPIKSRCMLYFLV